jgi:hypothetical protein
MRGADPAQEGDWLNEVDRLLEKGHIAQARQLIGDRKKQTPEKSLPETGCQQKRSGRRRSSAANLLSELVSALISPDIDDSPDQGAKRIQYIFANYTPIVVDHRDPKSSVSALFGLDGVCWYLARHRIWGPLLNILSATGMFALFYLFFNLSLVFGQCGFRSRSSRSASA